ncbi:Trehalose synthase [uncultured archaeon]|nr:Trehalose synthase [uncultured archaeon]
MRKKNKRPHIAFIGLRGIPSVIGGLERLTENIAPLLVKEGYCVTVYGRGEYTKGVRQYKGVSQINIPTPGSKHLETVTYSLLATLHATKADADIVHYYGTTPGIFSWIPRLAGKKTEVSFHGYEWKRPDWSPPIRAILRLLEPIAVYAPTAIYADSLAQKKYVQNKYKRNATYLPNFTLPPKKPVTGILKKHGLKPKSYVLYVGRITPTKGIETLIEASQSLPDSTPLVIAGSAIKRDDYLNKLKKNASKNTVFTGYIPPEELPELYENALLLVLPSLTAEGLPTSVIEAMYYGTCPLVSEVEGNTEAIGDCGITFKAANARDLSEKITSILTNKKKAQKIGEKAKKRARTEYSVENALKEFIKTHT